MDDLVAGLEACRENYGTFDFRKSVPGRKAYSLPSLMCLRSHWRNSYPVRVKENPCRVTRNIRDRFGAAFYKIVTTKPWCRHRLLSIRFMYHEIQSQDQRRSGEPSGFTGIHPYAPEHLVQGALELMYKPRST